MMLVPFSILAQHTTSLAATTGTLEDRLGRYGSRVRGRLASLAATSTRHADLLTSFPAAAVAIATRPAYDEGRAEAMALVADGEPLSAIARVLGLPAWMRKLPPEAFGQPLPARIGAPAFDTAFGQRALGLCPPLAGRPDRWLQAVIEACGHGDGDLALWLGSKRLFACRRVPMLPVTPLALYAWFSRHPEFPAAKLMFRPFDTKLGLGRAAMITRHWLMRVLQDMCVAESTTQCVWSRTAAAGAFQIVPLTTAAAIVEEGNVMSSCVGTYVGYVVLGDCRLYSIRDGSRRLATMELRALSKGRPPLINQIKGPHNAPVPEEVYDAAAGWLKAQLQIRGSRTAFHSGQHCETAFREAIWQPFAGRARLEGGGGQDQPAPSVAEILAMLAALRPFERT